jgi:chromosomal replication initiation ATPase DnaA
MRTLEQGLPRWDGRSPALIARQRAAIKSAKEAERKAKALAQVEAQQRAQEAAARRVAQLIQTTHDEIRMRPSGRAIAEAVAASYGYTFHELLSHRREKRAVTARHEAIAAVARARPDMSYPAIGRLFGRDHTSIIHALKKTGAYRATVSSADPTMCPCCGRPMEARQ